MAEHVVNVTLVGRHTPPTSASSKVSEGFSMMVLGTRIMISKPGCEEEGVHHDDSDRVTVGGLGG